MRNPLRLAAVAFVWLVALSVGAAASPARADGFRQARHGGKHLAHQSRHAFPRAHVGADAWRGADHQRRTTSLNRSTRKGLSERKHRARLGHRVHHKHGVQVWVPVFDSFELRSHENDESSTIESDGGVTIVIEPAEDGGDVITIILR